jgi:hypothetical protein
MQGLSLMLYNMEGEPFILTERIQGGQRRQGQWARILTDEEFSGQ